MTYKTVVGALVLSIVLEASAYGIVLLHEAGHVGFESGSLLAGALAFLGGFLFIFFVLLPVVATFVFGGPDTQRAQSLIAISPVVKLFLIKRSPLSRG